MSTATAAVPASLDTATDTTRVVPIRDLHTHPAQMRTVHTTSAMAALTLQVLQAGGVADWQPIVAAPRTDTDGYYIISGHRRRLALLFSWALVDAYPAMQTTLTVEQVEAFLGTLIAEHTTIEAAADTLLSTYANHTITIHLFTGDLKAQVLALQRANYGADAPDPLGIAKSFHAALATGSNEREIARNAGQSIGYVKKHLALLRVPPDLAHAIAAGTLLLSLAELVAEVQPEQARIGMAQFILANVAHITVEGVRESVIRFKAWDQFRTMPMSVAHQGQRNMIRILATLWQRTLSTDATRAWASAALLIYRNVSPHAPWENQAAYSEWVKALGGEMYYHEESGIAWDTLVKDCLTEVACETCPLYTLPSHLLSRDLSDRSDALGRPCRTPERDHYTRCINGFAPGDLVEVRVPFEWATHPGITKQGSHYVVISIDTLEQAWQAQHAAESVQEPDDIPDVTTDTGDTTPEAITSSLPAPVAGTVSTVGTPAPSSVPTSPTATPEPKGPAPISVMRAQIREYMEHHTGQAWQHPFATPCSTCQHRLTKSPTKDESVPHCAWASRLRTVRFTHLVNVDNALSIPVCHQYAPLRAWQDAIPPHPTPTPLPREYMLAQIRQHATTRGESQAFEFLTGRPMSPDSYSGWFATQLQEAIGTLSDAQLFTLFVWSLAEYDRHHQRRPFWLPADGQCSTFIPVSEISWR